MPSFKHKGKPMVMFAAFKEHLSLFPMRGMTGKGKSLIKEFETTKGPFHFAIEKPIPISAVKKIVGWG